MKRNLFKLIVAIIFCLFCGVGWTQTTTFDYTGAVQTYTVPLGVTSIRIEASGGQGGDGQWSEGGLGATMIGTFTVSPGDVLDVVVGEQGVLQSQSGGGGGGSGVIFLGDPMIVAGGGGGGAYDADATGGVTTETAGSSQGAGGTGGNGGEKGYILGNCGWGSGGGGFYGDGYGGDGTTDGGGSYLELYLERVLVDHG